MNSKFYVSLEAARLLKEKGYNELVKIYYSPIGYLNEVIGQHEERWLESDIIRSNNLYGLVNNEYLHEFGDFYSAPTKAEAIDWLESKGIVVCVYLLDLSKWGYTIINHKDKHIFGDFFEDKTRLEAEEAAIIEALELL